MLWAADQLDDDGEQVRSALARWLGPRSTSESFRNPSSGRSTIAAHDLNRDIVSDRPSVEPLLRPRLEGVVRSSEGKLRGAASTRFARPERHSQRCAVRPRPTTQVLPQRGVGSSHGANPQPAYKRFDDSDCWPRPSAWGMSLR